MAKDGFRVGVGAIGKSAEIVDVTRGELKKELNALKLQMEQVREHWEGSGANTFQQVQLAWSTQAQDLVDLLDHFRENLVSNDKQYTQDDMNTSDLLSKYTSQLGGK